MNGWIIAGVMLVVLVTWMVATIWSAPLGIEDEQGFRVIDLSCYLPEMTELHTVRGPALHFSATLMVPLWPV